MNLYKDLKFKDTMDIFNEVLCKQIKKKQCTVSCLVTLDCDLNPSSTFMKTILRVWYGTTIVGGVLIWQSSFIVSGSPSLSTGVW